MTKLKNKNCNSTRLDFFPEKNLLKFVNIVCVIQKVMDLLDILEFPGKFLDFPIQ